MAILKKPQKQRVLFPDGKNIFVDDIKGVASYSNVVYVVLADSFNNYTYTATSIAEAESIVNQVLASTQSGNGIIIQDTGTYTALIPQMVGYTSPSGLVTCSSDISGHEAWHGFADGAGDWQASDLTLPQWIQYNIGSSHVVKQYVIKTLSAAIAPFSWTLEASNDGVNWALLDQQTGYVWGSATSATFDISNSVSYQIYRVTVLAMNSSNTARIQDVQLNGT